MYDILKYKDIIDLQDEATIKRYEIISKLSKDFTIANDRALEMDKLLTEQIDMEVGSRPPDEGPELEEDAANEKPVTASPLPPKEKKQVIPSGTDIETQFRELFNALKDQQPRYIRYELPGITTVEMEKPEIDSFQQTAHDLALASTATLPRAAATPTPHLPPAPLPPTPPSPAHTPPNYSHSPRHPSLHTTST